MRRLAIVLLIVLLPSLVLAKTVKLTWDKIDNVEGVRVYHAKRYYVEEAGENQSFWDYDTPICEVAIDVNECEYDLIGIDGRKVKYLFIARSFIGDKESENSNEVEYVYDLFPPPAPTDLIGDYDKTTKIVTLGWSQPNEQWNEVKLWRVYYRIEDGEYIELGVVDDESNLVLSAPFDVAPKGVVTNVEFVVVAYRDSGKFSENSLPFTITIDRTDEIVVTPVKNLKIEIPLKE